MFWTGTRAAGDVPRRGEGPWGALNQFFLLLHGLREGVITLPRPPPPPFDVETMEPVRPPWRALKEWIPVENPEDDPDWFDQSNPWRPREILQDDRILVLDAD